MNYFTTEIAGYSLRVYKAGTAVVGTGAAGFNAADQLWLHGCRDVAIVTEGVCTGASRNTGSDKQTYYKLTLSGDEPDSVGEMARSLFAGQCMDGDAALVEAALSAPSFLRLCSLGVPFPTNRYGEYIGYKTDHDPKRRATSVGPLTSRKMTEALEKSVTEKNIPILDKLQVVSILTGNGAVKGLLCLDLSAEDRDRAYLAVCCSNIVWATGGPAGIYADSAYPVGHNGSTGVALEAGATAKNLTEWQYGLASLNPRWNVSGTYMQALPRFYSTDRAGGDQREFLADSIMDPSDMLTKIFLKGYEWPFDARKIQNGSSIIDILVYNECCQKNRRVFLDYTTNPGGGGLNFAALGQEAQAYLERAGANLGTPFQRLSHMNAPAVEFYRSRGVDLATQPLEIALCAQHNNGGLDVDAWWHTNIPGLFAAGEAAGTHGVYRPGGSALNAGQVGSARAARYIAARRNAPPDEQGFIASCTCQLPRHLELFDAVWNSSDTAGSLWKEAQKQMSRIGGPIRDIREISNLQSQVAARLREFPYEARAADIPGISSAYRYRDALICQLACLGAMADYIKQGGKSRGSALYRDPDGQLPQGLPELFRYRLDDGSQGNLVQLARYGDGKFTYRWRPVRPLPQNDDFFENVWREFRENGNIY